MSASSTERGRAGRVAVHQQVRVDVHSDSSNSSKSTSTTTNQQPQQQSGQTSRSTPATDARRTTTALPRTVQEPAAARTRVRSNTSDSAGRQPGAAAAAAAAGVNDDEDQTSLARLSTGNADKSEEELEKMRILARHIKVSTITEVIIDLFYHLHATHRL